jgi:hypothetical protein
MKHANASAIQVTTLKTRFPFLPASRGALGLFLGFVASTPQAGADERPTVMEAVTVSAPKTHTLFMGADISLSLGGELYPVRDVVGASWVLSIGGQEKLVSTKEAATNLKITPNLKLAEGSATIAGFNRVKAYTFANDPSVIITKRLTKAGMDTAMLEGVAQDARDYTDTVSNKVLGPSRIFAYSDKQFGDQAIQALANGGFKSSLNSDAGNAAVKYARHQEQIAVANTSSELEGLGLPTTQGLDAMDVDFVITSSKPLYNPYVVTITRFHPKNEKPGVVQNLVYAEALNPIGVHPLRVHLAEEGFPFDYEVVDFQLHLYDRGAEVATSMSNDRVEMTRDEAFQYVKMEYMDSHRGSTLPPTPAMGILPAALPARLAAGDYASPFFVKVSREGTGDEIYADRACSKRIDDPFLESVMRNIRFKPALAHGRTVPGVAEVDLGKLQI